MNTQTIRFVNSIVKWFMRSTYSSTWNLFTRRMYSSVLSFIQQTLLVNVNISLMDTHNTNIYSSQIIHVLDTLILIDLKATFKGIRYSYRGGNDVANVNCYFLEVKLWLIGKRCCFRLIFIIQTYLTWKRVHGPLFFKMPFGLITWEDNVCQFSWKRE